MELLESYKAMNHPWPVTRRGMADTIGNQITHSASARQTSRPTCLDAAAAAFVIIRASDTRVKAFYQIGAVSGEQTSEHPQFSSAALVKQKAGDRAGALRVDHAAGDRAGAGQLGDG
jgi:hypothetical protein